MRLTLHRPAWLADPRLSATGPAAAWAALVLTGFVMLVDDATELESEEARMHGPTLALCEEGVLMSYDVQWAASCSTLAERGLTDGHAECDLPDDEAGRLNRLLQQAERKCRVEAAMAMPR